MTRFRLWFLGIIFVFGCSNSTGPKNHDTEPLATAEVGSAGGELSSGDVKLTIPSGSFTQSATIALTLAPEQISGAPCVSPTYQITGMSPDFAKPLELKVRYTGALSGKTYIAAGWKTTIPESGETQTVYEYLNASEAGGYLVATLSPVTGAIGLSSKARFSADDDISGEDHILAFFGITRHGQTVSPDSRFSLKYPLSADDLAPNLLKYMQDAVQKFTDAGYNFRVEQSSYRTVDQGNGHIRTFSDEQPVRSYINSYPMSSDNYEYGYCVFSFYEPTVRAAGLEKVRIAVGSEYFGLLYQASLPAFSKSQVWLEKAGRAWAEEVFAGTSSHVPESFRGNELAPLKGLGQGEAYANPKYKDYYEGWREVTNYGNGMSALLSYLCADQRYGKGLMPAVLDKIRTGKHSAEALVEAVGASPRDWWPDFLKEYLTGKIYSVPASTFLSSPDGEFTIASEHDSLKTFSGDYYGLAAKRFRINLEWADIDSATTLTLAVDDDDASVLVFGVKNGALEYLDRGGEVHLEHIRDLARSGYDLLAVAANSSHSENYLDSTPITLTIAVERPTQPIPSLFSQASFKVTVTARLLKQRTNFPDEQISSLLEPAVYPFLVTGSLVQNVFTGSKTVTTADVTQSFHIKAVFDEAGGKILSFEVTGTIAGKETTYDIAVSGGDIPYSSALSGWKIFQISGENTCGKITNYRYVNETKSTTLGQTITTRYELLDFSCGKESLLYLQFK
jgi:hypothetical protein